MTANVKALIARWRESADFHDHHNNREYASALDQCATDLEQALAEFVAPWVERIADEPGYINGYDRVTEADQHHAYMVGFTDAIRGASARPPSHQKEHDDHTRRDGLTLTDLGEDSRPQPKGSEQTALRDLVNAAMVIIGNAVDFNDKRQMFVCTVCRYRDPLGDEGSKLHADECPIYKLHAATDIAGQLIEPATWANAGATKPEAHQAESAHGFSSFGEIPRPPQAPTDEESLYAPASDRLREQLAALAHKQWSGWMRYLFGKCSGVDPVTGHVTMPSESVVWWQRQMNTPYADLSEAEKDSDRKEADRVLALLGQPDASAPTGWQPIETAPKDGTDVLLCVKWSDTRWLRGIGCWNVGRFNDNAAWNWTWTTQPTHWMPLPAPPDGSSPATVCADCGAPLNGGEAKCFTICTPCWDRVYAPDGSSPMRVRTAIESVGWLHTEGPLSVSPKVTHNEP